MNNILAYLEIAFAAVGVVESIRVLIANKKTVPVTAALLTAAIQPVIMALQAALPSVALPAALINDLTAVAADFINKL